MTYPGFILLYVANPAASAAFYTRLLGNAPVESAPTFALFALDSGMKLGLWARHEVQPAAALAGGGAELCFPLGNDAEVDAWHARWHGQGLPIILPPQHMDFGYTFVATDPDGHRLRVFAPSQP